MSCKGGQQQRHRPIQPSDCPASWPSVLPFTSCQIYVLVVARETVGCGGCSALYGGGGASALAPRQAIITIIVERRTVVDVVTERNGTTRVTERCVVGGLIDNQYDG